MMSEPQCDPRQPCLIHVVGFAAHVCDLRLDRLAHEVVGELLIGHGGELACGGHGVNLTSGHVGAQRVLQCGGRSRLALDFSRAHSNAHAMTNDEPKLIGSKDVCDLLNINRSTLVRWIADKKVTPAGRLSTGAWLFDAEYIAELARSRSAA